MLASLKAHRIRTTLIENGTLTLEHLPFQAGETVEIIVLPNAVRATDFTVGIGEPRPFGLGAGDFVVPDDFDAPLPEEVLRDFEHKLQLVTVDTAIRTYPTAPV